VNFPLVSVLLPAFNHERYIEKCLNAFAEDDYPNKECIIINDGSTDKTNEKIMRWIEKHQHQISINYLNRENRGLCATLNELASRAKGEFLRLLASDDYFLNGGTQAQINYLIENPHKLAVIGDFVVVDENDRKLFESGFSDFHRINKANYSSDNGIRREVICRWAISGAVLMIRSSTFQTLSGWDETLKIEDWDFFLRLVANNYLGFVDVKVCAYRIHQKNTCRVKDRLVRIENLRALAHSAKKNMDLFLDPDQTFLEAQYHLIRAKIKFLSRNPISVFINMGKFFLLNVTAYFIEIRNNWKKEV